MQNKAIHILRIDSSARNKHSYSRQLTGKLVERLKHICGGAVVTEMWLPERIPFLSEEMVETMFTVAANRSETQNRLLHVSDQLAQELMATDILVLGVPVYNFGVPASLKAYIDMIVRSGVTFKYTEQGPVGLVENVKAFIVVTSGGTALNSDADFVSRYLTTVLAFIGIKDVQFIDATQIRLKGEGAVMSHAIAAVERAGAEV